jgi:hypothetical protein
MARALKRHSHSGLASPPPAVIPLGPPANLNPPRKSQHGSETRQRRTAIRVRVFPHEMERLKSEAAAAGMSVAGYLRSGRLGEGAAGPRVRRRLPVIEARLLAQADAEMNHIGSNINQTARALNELLLSGVQSGDDRLGRLIEDILEMNRTAYRDLAVTLAATRQAAGYDREG